MIIFMLFCILLLGYVWLIYPLVIIVISRLKTTSFIENNTFKEWPGISIIIAARNEEKVIKQRIINLLNSDYPGEIEILVGSDGSTDTTAEVVDSFNMDNIRAIKYHVSRGRAMVHNDTVPKCKHKIIIFTDAETNFEPDCLSNLVKPFANKQIGCTVGRILYDNAGKTGISESAGLYWKMEEAIRIAESQLGILCFGTGACTAIRKSLFRSMNPWEDIDYAATLMLAIQGSRIQYVPEAIAHDIISESPQSAFHTRVRQTSRSFTSIIKRSIPAIISKSSIGIAVASFSHKTGRHLSPFFLLGSFVSSTITFFDSFLSQIVLLILLAFSLLSIVGYFTNNCTFRFRLGSIALSFFVLNLARGIGVIQALTNKRATGYVTRI